MQMKRNPISFFWLCIILELCVHQSKGNRNGSNGRRHHHRFIHVLATDEETEEEKPEENGYQYPSKKFWLSDGLKQMSFDVNTVTCKEAKPGEKYSAMWKDRNGGVNDGEHYWEIHIDNIEEGLGVISVGLTNPVQFRYGRGLLYSGDLENGRTPLVLNYGPRFKFGDTIGILVSFLTKGKLKLYFYYNERSLGLAYNVDSYTLPNAQPVIQFTTPGMVSIVKEAEIPMRRTRESAHYSGIEGDWKVIRNEIFFNGKQFNTQHVTTEINPHIVTLQITPRDYNQYSGLIQVVNNIRFSVRSERNTWKMIPFVSTYIAVPDYHLRILEDNFFAMTNNGNVTLVRRNLKLEKGSSNVLFQRYNRIPKTVTKNPLTQVDYLQCFCPCSDSQ